MTDSDNKLNITDDQWIVLYSRKLGELDVSHIIVGQKNGHKEIAKTYDVNTHHNDLAYVSYDVGEANAKLIADAGTVANKTNLLPSQLLEQRNQLLNALEEAINGTKWNIETYPNQDWKADQEKVNEWEEILKSIKTRK